MSEKFISCEDDKLGSLQYDKIITWFIYFKPPFNDKNGVYRFERIIKTLEGYVQVELIKVGNEELRKVKEESVVVYAGTILGYKKVWEGFIS